MSLIIENKKKNIRTKVQNIKFGVIQLLGWVCRRARGSIIRSIDHRRLSADSSIQSVGSESKGLVSSDGGRQGVFKVELLLGVHGTTRKELLDDRSVLVLGGRKNVKEIIGQASLAFGDEGVVGPSRRDEGRDQ